MNEECKNSSSFIILHSDLPLRNWSPAIGIWGRSGSGKTVLIEQLLQGVLNAENLVTAVVKRCSHRMEVDTPGKDSDRMFGAGADVLAHNPSQAFLRIHSEGASLEECLIRLGRGYDLVLVEGHRESSIPKIWLLRENETEPPPEAENVLDVLPWGSDRAARACPIIMDCLRRAHAAVPTCAAVLIGGQGSRMGGPKAMLKVGGEFLLEKIVSTATEFSENVVLVGEGPVPASLENTRRLSDVPHAPGPLGGILSALRWRPEARWVILACDLPFATPDAFRWLLEQAKPGIWAVLPHLDEPELREPLFAVYEPPAATLLERGAAEGVFCTQRILAGNKVASPRVPPHLRQAWINVNTPEERDAATGSTGGQPV